MRAWQAGAAALAAAGYASAVVRRNRGLRPPPVRDAEGRPLPARPFAFSDGERVSVIDAGAGPPILWVPGADGVKETFRYQLPAFAADYRVIAPDMRARFPADASFNLLVDDLAELLSDRQPGPAVVVGQSLGGSIAIRFATRFPELVRGLVLANTLTRVSYEHLGLNRTALVPIAIGTTRYLPTGLARRLARFWCRESVWIYDPAGCHDLTEYALWTGPRTVPSRISSRRVGLLKGLDLRPELVRIAAPTLVVKGPLDVYCPPSWAREIAERIPGARYEELEGTGHCSHISMPEAFNSVVEAWLREILAGR